VMVFGGKRALSGGKNVCLPGLVGGRVNTDA
jgi:hypothetical protein